MGVSRDSRHKRRSTGGRMPVHKKKRLFEMGRQATMTKLLEHGEKRIQTVKGRGGNLKFKALRIKTGNFSWGSETVTKKTRIIDVTYNATNNELTRTKTVVKNCIVQVDATPFKQWYQTHYGIELGKKKDAKEDKAEEKPAGKALLKRQKKHNKDRIIDQKVADQFNRGRLYACISSRPGQTGRADGYILEGRELEFYIKKMDKKKK